MFRIFQNVPDFSIFPRFHQSVSKSYYTPKTSVPVKKPRTITKYNKELKRYEDIELSI